ncbi:hypothetical protein Sme01_22450 [Sphaerisporangium melleum]|uniref:Uncharacterized protein n=1 Tax=Sphaerisporangium melleum TaxID=321316 RepID=A0A917QZK5_9ACTN|nr:hypothetical protein [Sphaerisporangium melleum]GGK78850.1 hypothetical protein GCM10007964_21920 [Sphaerisporangium melleum]GII69769.1 hypothetical protein Sme01_22450 [Sphaerisporangium melleum]
MAPELHYQLIQHRVAELHGEADERRRVREAASGRQTASGRDTSQHRLRAAFGKLRLS